MFGNMWDKICLFCNYLSFEQFIQTTTMIIMFFLVMPIALGYILPIGAMWILIPIFITGIVLLTIHIREDARNILRPK